MFGGYKALKERMEESSRLAAKYAGSGNVESFEIMSREVIRCARSLEAAIGFERDLLDRELKNPKFSSGKKVQRLLRMEEELSNLDSYFEGYSPEEKHYQESLEGVRQRAKKSWKEDVLNRRNAAQEEKDSEYYQDLVRTEYIKSRDWVEYVFDMACEGTLSQFAKMDSEERKKVIVGAIKAGDTDTLKEVLNYNYYVYFAQAVLEKDKTRKGKIIRNANALMPGEVAWNKLMNLAKENSGEDSKNWGSTWAPSQDFSPLWEGMGDEEEKDWEVGSEQERGYESLELESQKPQPPKDLPRLTAVAGSRDEEWYLDDFSLMCEERFKGKGPNGSTLEGESKRLRQAAYWHAHKGNLKRTLQTCDIIAKGAEISLTEIREELEDLMQGEFGYREIEESLLKDKQLALDLLEYREGGIKRKELEYLVEQK